MCQTAVGLISSALPEVDNAESLLKIKNLIALFMQTMNVSERNIALHSEFESLIVLYRHRHGNSPLVFSINSFWFYFGNILSY